jgi:hypothetical protein
MKILKPIEKNGKIRCEVCKQFYKQVGSHVVQTHAFKTAREYRKKYGFDVKRGQLPKDYRKLKAYHVFNNGTVENLKAGKKYWFKKGDKINYERSPQTIARLKHLIK